MLGTTNATKEKPKPTAGWTRTLAQQARQLMDAKATARVRVDEDVKKAEATAAKALEALKATQREVDRQKQIRAREVGPIDHKLQTVLRELALINAPLIGAVRARIESRVDEMRRRSGTDGGLNSREYTDGYDREGHLVYKVVSNRKHVETIVEKVRDARDRLAALRDDPPEDLETELGRIEGSIPWHLLQQLDAQ
jgi:hypothetical protein